MKFDVLMQIAPPPENPSESNNLEFAKSKMADFCMYLVVMIVYRRLKVKTVGQGHSEVNANTCVLHEYHTAASYEYWLVVVVVGFHRDVIGCELVRRCVRLMAGKESSTCGRSNAIGLTLILDRGQFL